MQSVLRWGLQRCHNRSQGSRSMTSRSPGVSWTLWRPSQFLQRHRRLFARLKWDQSWNTSVLSWKYSTSSRCEAVLAAPINGTEQFYENFEELLLKWRDCRFWRVQLGKDVWASGDTRYVHLQMSSLRFFRCHEKMSSLSKISESYQNLQGNERRM